MTPRDPQSLSEWIGYFLFHDRATVSYVHEVSLVIIGFWIGRLVEWKRSTQRKAKTQSSKGEPRA